MKREIVNGYESIVGTGIKLLSDTDLERIHKASLELLWQHGLLVEGENVREKYRQAGAKIEGEIVKIPEYLVEEAIRTSPGSLLLCGRDSQHDILLEKGRSYFTPGKQPCYLTDPDTGEYRFTTRDDLAKMVRLVDALEEYDMNDATVVSTDVPPEVHDFYNFATCAANTSKYLMTIPYMPKEKLELFLEMPIAVAGGLENLQKRPFIRVGSGVISPQYMPQEAGETFITVAEKGLPALGYTMVMAGGTGPAALAGSLVQHNAEVLACLVLTQITRPGAPFFYASSLGMMYLKTAVTCVGCVEAALLNAAATQLAQMYNLPCGVGGG